MKKLVSLFLALLMVTALVPASFAEALEPITFDVYYIDNYGGINPADMDIMKDYAERHKDKNVTINWISLGDPSMAQERISVLFSSGDYGDAVYGNPLQESHVSMMSAQGLLLSLDQFITPENTPSIYEFFQRVPSAKAVSTLPDGNYYTLPRLNGNPGDYLESPIWVNKEWLAKLNLEVPTTTTEFEAMLQAFKDGDPNGNGEADEIPLLIQDGDSMKHMEVWLGIYGIPTKNNNFDSFVYVQDGKVVFAPVTDAYKDGIKWLSSLYEKGLIYQDMFTTTVETVTAKLSGEVPVVGVVTHKNMGKFAEQYVQILPPKAEGYEPSWFYHPGALGIKNFFSITNNCKDPVRLLNYFDEFWTTEQTLRNNYGATLVEREDGTFGFQDPPGGVSLAEYQMYNCLGVNFVLYAEDFGTKFDISIEDSVKKASYELYLDVLNDEIWPRPFFPEDLAFRANELRTDIFNTVNQMKASWITGQSDIDADWEGYLKNLQKMGIDEFVSLYQEAYDVYNAGLQ